MCVNGVPPDRPARGTHCGIAGGYPPPGFPLAGGPGI